MVSSRYKRGWFGESYRHYLASKGVITSRSISNSPNRYFQMESALAPPVRHYAKGNPHMNDPRLAFLRQAGWDDKRIYADPEGAFEASKGEDGTSAPIRMDTLTRIIERTRKRMERESRQVADETGALYREDMGRMDFRDRRPLARLRAESEIPLVGASGGVVGGSSRFERIEGSPISSSSIQPQMQQLQPIQYESIRPSLQEQTSDLPPLSEDEEGRFSSHIQTPGIPGAVVDWERMS